MPRQSNRRELLINIATMRFLISGYDIVTVDELCELSSSTKGSFYHFFANKESLAVDVVNHVWYETQELLVENFSSDEPPAVKLAAEVDRIATSYLRYDGKRYFIGCPIGTLALSLRGKSLKLTRRLNFALNHIHQFYQHAYTEGLADGSIEKSASASDLADLLLIKLQGLSTLGKAFSNPAKIKDLSAGILTTIS
jgi:TetR/AcrR family transcriptional repressor of nem operon